MTQDPRDKQGPGDTERSLVTSVETDQPLPKVCPKHPNAVWHDEPECPACKAEREFLHLTKDMERR
jgi:hypothetical protein